MSTRTPIPVVLAALLAPSAPADILMTVDGRTIDGPEMERTEQAVIVHFENGDVEVPLEMVKDVFIGEDTSRLSHRERRRIEREMEEKREQLEEALTHTEWRDRYIVETDNFTWQYTIPAHIGEAMQERFEAYYDYFRKRWRLRRDRNDPKLPVNFYRTAEQYQRVSGSPPSALAYFRYVKPYDLNSFYNRLDPVETEMVLYHELSHYAQKLVEEDFNYPHWPSEGVAEYYGGSLYDEEEEELRIGLVQEGRLAQVKEDLSLGKFVSIREIVTEPAYTDYTWGWALVHFFMNDRRMADDFEDYFLGLARDRNVDRRRGPWNLETVSGEESLRYLLDCLGIDEDELPELDKRFQQYVRDELQLETSTAKEKAAIAAQRVGKRLRATRLFEEAQEEGGLSANGYYQFARMVRWKEKARAKSLYRKAIEEDPLVGTYYYELGRLIEEEDEEEAARLRALGKELDPEVGAYTIDISFEVEQEPDED